MLMRTGQVDVSRCASEGPCGTGVSPGTAGRLRPGGRAGISLA